MEAKQIEKIIEAIYQAKILHDYKDGKFDFRIAAQKLSEVLKSLPSPPIDLVEVEKLVQSRVDQLYGLENTGERKGAVEYFRQLCNYTINDLPKESEGGK